MAKEESKQIGTVVSADQIATLQDDDYRRIYANSSRISATPWDVQITFGQVTGVEKGSPLVIDSMTAILSPPQAKALGAILHQIIAEYEKQYGPVPDPDAILAALAGKK